MNILSTAAATVIVKAINMAENPDNVSSTIVYGQGKKAFLLKIGNFQFNWCMAVAVILLICSYVILYKTKFGLRLMACGENPQAADSVGINVYKMRWAGVLISGALGGIGGIVYITAGVSEWKFETGVAGFGFLASLEIPGSVYNMMPYIISLVVLAFTSRNSRAPKAEGIPYDKGSR